MVILESVNCESSGAVARLSLVDENIVQEVGKNSETTQNPCVLLIYSDSFLERQGILINVFHFTLLGLSRLVHFASTCSLEWVINLKIRLLVFFTD